MTYRELYESATRKLEKSKITLGEYEEMTKPLNEDIREWIPVGWIPNSKCGYPKPEDEYKHFLTIDNKGEITIQEFLLSLDEEPQPYFTGMRNIVAWMPLPEPYKADREVSE